MRNIHIHNRTLHKRNNVLSRHTIRRKMTTNHPQESMVPAIPAVSTGSGINNTNLERLRSSLASLTLSKPKKRYIKF